MHYCTLEVEHADSCSSMSLLTYRELWEEDDRGVCSCDGWTLVHAGLPHLRDASDTRTVDLSSAPVEMKSEESTTVEKEEEDDWRNTYVHISPLYSNSHSSTTDSIS